MKGCLLIHGFTGTPYEIMPLANYLQSHTDWIIRTPTLPGHGNKGNLDQVTWKEWVRAVEEELQGLFNQCQEVYVVGFSMGGMIASYLAARYPINKLVLLSAAVFYMNPLRFLQNVKEVVWTTWKSGGSISESMEQYRKKVKNTPLRAVFHFRKLVKSLIPYIPEIEVPILIIQGDKDDLVKPKSAHYIYEHVQSAEKELFILQNSKHTVCHDCEKELIFGKVHQFFVEQKVLT